MKNDNNLKLHDPRGVEIVPGGPIDGSIRPPGSKSLTNRALICAAFANSKSTLSGALCSEDTDVMIDALLAIGIEVAPTDGGRSIAIDPSSPNVAKFPNISTATVEMFIANSGTSVRFLTAALSAYGGVYRLSGVDRMHARPIGDLIDAIDPVIDGSIKTTSEGRCPPVLIQSSGWRGDRIEVAGSVSSQFLSGLMMAAPIALARNQATSLTIEVVGELVSRPYVDLTANVMRSFGANVTLKDSAAGDSLAVSVAGSYRGASYSVEPDASAASYFWAAAAISGGTVTVTGLSRDAMQGDVGFCDVLQQMGCNVRFDADSITVVGGPLRGVDVNMNSISDTVQTLAVVCLFASGPTRVRGVAHNRFKETDRIGDLARELRKLGATVDEHDDGMTITPLADQADYQGATLETYHDHRMAMSLSLAGLRIEGVCISDPGCTSKTYPDYFADLERLIGRPHRWA